MTLENLPFDGCVFVKSDVGVDHFNHMGSTDERVDVPKELETFFIWNR